MADEIKTPALLYVQEANLPQGSNEWLSDVMVAQAILDAVALYSRYYPQELVETIAGADEALYDLSAGLSAAWLEGFSSVFEIEHPYDSDDTGANVLGTSSWRIVADPTYGEALRLELEAATGETILVRFTGQHTEATVRADHIGGVAKLAASNLCLSLAARASSFKESTVGGNWNPGGAKANFDSLATKFRKEGEASLGIDSRTGPGVLKSTAPACSIKGMNTDALARHGYGRLTKRRWR